MSMDTLAAIPGSNAAASVRSSRDAEIEEIVQRLSSLNSAIARGASSSWLLWLWSRFIRTRDRHQCVNCGSAERVQAHHIVRKVLYPWGAFEPGNGISLCRDCHKRVHASFNRRPDLTVPLGAENGDDQDEWAFLFGRLLEDAVARGLDLNEFYFIGDHMLRFFVKAQGYDDLYASVKSGDLSRLQFAHEIWRGMPEEFYVDFASTLLQTLLSPKGTSEA